MTNEVLGSVENVARANAVRVSGLLAEMLYAFSFFIAQGKSDVNPKHWNQKSKFLFLLTLLQKIATARDKLAVVKC